MLAMAGRPPGRMREGIGFDMRRRLFVCSVVVGVVGLLGALVLYLRAPEASDYDENDQVIIVDGKTYRIPLASTKTYRRDLRRFGGEGAVLLDDINRWFAGLWRGKALGITTAWITAFVSVGLFLLARQMPSDPSPHAGGGDEGGG